MRPLHKTTYACCLKRFLRPGELCMNSGGDHWRRRSRAEAECIRSALRRVGMTLGSFHMKAERGGNLEQVHRVDVNRPTARHIFPQLHKPGG